MKNLLIFAAGIGIGSAATYFIVKDKIRKEYEEEYAQTRAFYTDKVNELEKAKNNVIPNENPDAEVVEEIDIQRNGPKERRLVNPSLKDVAAQIITEEKYTAEPKKDVRKKLDLPYVISPDEFGDLDYECIDLTYYEDDILADDEDEIIDDVLETVGPEALDAFGREDGEEEFVVHVRNDARKCDYEITRDFRNYDDVIRAEAPHF